MRRWFYLWGPETVALLTKALLLAFIIAFCAAKAADAATLSAHGRQNNLYGGLEGTGRVCFDLHLKKPKKIEVDVVGARVWADGMEDSGGSWAQREQFQLRAGHRHFCRSYTLRYWTLVPALQLVYRAKAINAVHAELYVGIYPDWHQDLKGVRVYEKTTLLKGEQPFLVAP